MRTEGDCSLALAAGEWSAPMVNAQLPDGRRLLVTHGRSMAHVERAEELKAIHATIAKVVSSLRDPPANPRALVTAVDDRGTRRFLEVAA